MTEKQKNPDDDLGPTKITFTPHWRKKYVDFTTKVLYEEEVSSVVHTLQ